MKHFQKILKLVLFFSFPSLYSQTCIPSGFSPYYTDLGSICFGYAQTRAFGCSDGYAATVYTSTVNFSFFTRVSGESLAGIAVGDIVVWGKNELIDQDHGHAAYVSGVQVQSPQPVGSDRPGSLGNIVDKNPPTPFSAVTLDQVSAAGQSSSQGVSFQSVWNSRVVTNGDYFVGVYKPKTGGTGPTYKITFKNSFAGGYMQVGKNGSTWINRNTPYEEYFTYNAQIPARAEDQNAGNYKWTFDASSNAGWTNSSDQTVYTTREISVVVSNAAETYTAHFASQSATSFVDFENRSDTVHIGGVITVAGVDRKSKTEQYSTGTTATAKQNMTIDRVYYTFSQWKLNGSWYSYDLSITPNNAGTYQAFYTFIDIMSPDELNPYGNAVGQPIKITWKLLTSSFADQIQVWRKVKNVHSAMVIATLSATATEYTDYDYQLTSGYTDNLIDYDMRVRYRVNNTYSDVNWFTVFGEMGAIAPITPKDQFERLSVSNVPKSSSFSAYPNPFNPSTTISYTLERPSYVEMNIFDLTGRVVGKFAYENQSAGVHQITWHSKDQSGMVLSSGTYVVRFASFPLDGSRPQTLYHKLLLLK